MLNFLLNYNYFSEINSLGFLGGLGFKTEGNPFLLCLLLLGLIHYEPEFGDTLFSIPHTYSLFL